MRARALLLAVLAAIAVVTPGAVGTGAAQAPAGVVRVAYPEEPVVWHPALGSSEVPGDLPATVDTAALWGLPLFRIDAWGQLRPGLAESATVVPGEPWTVELRLRPGRWSDGRPVVAADVVATVAALRDVAPDQAPLLGADAVDDRTVRLRFARPAGRWPYLLTGGWSVLPAHVLAEGGIEAYRAGVPVSGGPFHLDAYEPGLRAVFVANRDSPLGAPGVERIEVYVTPAYETALGLLRDQRVDVAAGYLAPNPVDRAARVEGARAEAPLGGTWMVLRWRDVDEAVRRAARDAVHVEELIEGLLGDAGAPATATLPGVEGPWSPSGGTEVGALDGSSLSLLLPGLQEVLGFTSRVVQRELRTAGATVELARVEFDDLDRDADGALLVRRDAPRPSLLARAPEDAGEELGRVLAAADAAGSVRSRAARRAQEAIFADATELPIARLGVAHAWRQELTGVVPSAWPGIAFWSVADWRWPAEGAPEQRPALGK